MAAFPKYNVTSIKNPVRTCLQSAVRSVHRSQAYTMLIMATEAKNDLRSQFLTGFSLELE